MLKHLIRIAVMALAVVSMGFFALTGLRIHFAGRESQVKSALQSLREITALMEEYSELQNGQHPYPEKLSDLVSSGLISQRDFEKMNDHLDIRYFPPSTLPPSPNHILLLAGAGHMICYATVDGKVNLLPNRK